MTSPTQAMVQLIGMRSSGLDQSLVPIIRSHPALPTAQIEDTLWVAGRAGAGFIRSKNAPERGCRSRDRQPLRSAASTISWLKRIP